MQKKYNKATQKLINYAELPYQVFTKENTIKEVMYSYEEEMEKGKKAGFIPVLVVATETMAEWMEQMEAENYSKEVLLSQERRDGKKILEERFSKYIEDVEDDEKYMQQLMSKEEKGEKLTSFLSLNSYMEDGIQEETILFEVPVKKPWQVIAWFPMGGWNEAPDAADMIDICKYWYEKYGAIPAVFSHDTLEFKLDKVVTDTEQAWAVAKEHYSFCPDRVDQGTERGTLGEVADCISKSSIWFFWWD